MSPASPKSPDLAPIRSFLTSLGQEPSSLRPLTGGAWSRAFAFDSDSQPRVLRIAGPAEDYEADAFVAALRIEGVPVPDVLARGRIDHGPLTGTTFAISERAAGIPLERVAPADWPALVPQLAGILESLRHTPPPASQAVPGWREHLLEVGTYPWQAGWRRQGEPTALAMFDRGVERLREVCPGTVPVSLIHADWINRNVHVGAGRITGVFDWGCYRFGDHLYDLAWFEFWAPWHRNLDVGMLTAALRRRWRDAGLDPLAEPGRRLACLLHIGLDHIVYNTVQGTPEALRGTMNRLAIFLDELS